jgi:hypothetical protein
MRRKRPQVLGADLNRWQGARPGLGESLADRGGDSAVAESLLMSAGWPVNTPVYRAVDGLA